MSYVRSDIVTEVRDTIYEGTADILSDVRIRRFIASEIRSLPRKRVYLQEIHTTSTVVDQLDYVLPTGTFNVEKVERNFGTASLPDWIEVSGWRQYGGAIYLAERPSTVWTMRCHLQKGFTVPSDDVTAVDVPDDKVELVVLGAAVRCYRAIIGYLKDAKNWDAIAKPDGISLSQIHAWYRDLKKDYKEALDEYRTTPLPRDIDLVN